MIKNEKQYRITKAAAQKFAAAVGNFDERPAAHPGVTPRLIRAMREAMISELEILQEQIKDYERLRRRGRVKLKLAELRTLPTQIIRARIAAGLTQAELAQRLGLKTQQIQRYEAGDYEMASFARILEIAQAIDQAAQERR
jgi:ribosome-binding protein aMBF1 (putative translation factor)